VRAGSWQHTEPPVRLPDWVTCAGHAGLVVYADRPAAAKQSTFGHIAARAVVPLMRKQRRGRIVAISSVVGQSGNAGQANYAASKAGLIGFCKSLAREVGSRQVTVNVVAPGFIATDMTRGLAEGAQEQWISQVPLGRLGSPADVASAVCFLASDEASYITGQILAVNGGMYT